MVLLAAPRRRYVARSIEAHSHVSPARSLEGAVVAGGAALRYLSPPSLSSVGLLLPLFIKDHSVFWSQFTTAQPSLARPAAPPPSQTRGDFTFRVFSMVAPSMLLSPKHRCHMDFEMSSLDARKAVCNFFQSIRNRARKCATSVHDMRKVDRLVVVAHLSLPFSRFPLERQSSLQRGS